MGIDKFINDIPTLKQLKRLDEIDSSQCKEPPYGACYASAFNDKFCVTFAVWRNDYGRCYEIGLRDLVRAKADEKDYNSFKLSLQSRFNSCYTRFVRLAKLIKANRDLSYMFREKNES